MKYELKTAAGKAVVWEGGTPEEAARRYVDCNRSEAVIAWREHPRHGVYPYANTDQIVD